MVLDGVICMVEKEVWQEEGEKAGRAGGEEVGQKGEGRSQEGDRAADDWKEKDAGESGEKEEEQE